jgi:hypothetical protein
MGMDLDVVSAGADGADHVIERTGANLGDGGKQALDHESRLEAMAGEHLELVFKTHHPAVDLTVKIALHVGGQVVLFPGLGDRKRFRVQSKEHVQHKGSEVLRPLE